jgi:hypothetical protein
LQTNMMSPGHNTGTNFNQQNTYQTPMQAPQNSGTNLPSVLYLDHAQIKLLARRLTHIKEKLNHEQVEFVKTKTRFKQQ